MWSPCSNRLSEPALGLLLKLLNRTPGLWLGQVIAEAVRPAHGCPELVAVEDGELAARLERMLEVHPAAGGDMAGGAGDAPSALAKGDRG